MWLFVCEEYTSLDFFDRYHSFRGALVQDVYLASSKDVLVVDP